MKKYPTKPINKTVRMLQGERRIGPAAPAGCAISPGWMITDDGYYVRETTFVDDHVLLFFKRKAPSYTASQYPM